MGRACNTNGEKERREVQNVQNENMYKYKLRMVTFSLLILQYRQCPSNCKMTNEV
jgi:hypothetical protein